MGLYKFYAAGKGEKPREVLIEADSQREATDKLRSRHLTPIESYGDACSGWGWGFIGRFLSILHSVSVSATSKMGRGLQIIIVYHIFLDL